MNPPHLFRRTLVSLLLTAALSHCSQRAAPVVEEEPLLPESPDVMRDEAVAGGMTTQYTAHFDGTRLERITEVRTPADQGGAKSAGSYTFNGGRLIEYKGAALGGDAQIELTFDMRGVVTSSQGGADDREISAIVNRAELLRSLALARRSSREHAG